MKSNWVKIAAGSFILLLLVAVGVSQTVKRVHMHDGDMFSGHMMHFFSDYLDLTDAQQAQVKQILDREKPNMKPMFQQMMQSHKDMQSVVQAATFDEAKARTVATAQAQNMIEMEVQKARVESELYQVLTPDQKTKMNEYMAKREQRMMQHKQTPPQSDSTEQN